MFNSIQNSDFEDIKEEIEKNMQNKNIKIEIEKYKFDKNKDKIPVDAAIAKIQEIMQNMEIELIKNMVNDNILDTDKILVVDGSLQFMTQKYDPEIFYNVIGISKSFNPNLEGLLKNKIQIGVLLSKLKFGERTPVYEYNTEGRIKNKIGAWYLRIHEHGNIKNPLEGVVKIEKMAIKEEESVGFDSGTIDNISMSILAERNPTCYGNDNRWANHIYPIYLTEKFLKSNFLSNLYFMNLF